MQRQNGSAAVFVQLSHWQAQRASVMQMALPPGISDPGVQDAVWAPQLTEHPAQLPCGEDFGALQVLFLAGGVTTGMPMMGSTAIPVPGA
jgi:hypothetical protein